MEKASYFCRKLDEPRDAFKILRELKGEFNSEEDGENLVKVIKSTDTRKKIWSMRRREMEIRRIILPERSKIELKTAEL